MKKSLLFAAMFASGLAFVSLEASQNFEPVSIEQQEGKVKIEIDQLPDAVKTTISKDETVNTLKIVEAWKWTRTEGVKLFEVQFDNGTEEKLSKKYDEEGNEIKE